MRHGLGLDVDERLLLRGERGPCLLVLAAVQDDAEPPLREPRRHVDRALEHERPGLCEPEAVLLDQVEREPVRAGRPRADEVQLRLERLTGPDRLREGRALAVPDDRVPERVEPVRRELHALAAARTPGRGARILEQHPRDGRLTGPDRRHPVPAPADGERAGGDGMLADALHGGISSRPHGRAAPRPRRAARARRAHAGVVHAPGGPLAPEYREIRKRHTLFEVCEQPELCAEVTLQPVRRHDVDAAVMFADIMLPVLLRWGSTSSLVENVGPVVREPIRSRADVDRLGSGEPDARILEAVRIVRRELRPDQAVVGFCGGPFTVAGYLVEGKPSRDFTTLKALMYREPEPGTRCWSGSQTPSRRTSPGRSRRART